MKNCLFLRFVCLLIIGVGVMLVADNTHAQPTPRAPIRIAKPIKDTSTWLGFTEVTAGPYFTAGFSRQNVNLLNGWRAESSFAYMFGGIAELAVNKWLAFDLGLYYDTRGVYLATPATSPNGGVPDKDTVSADVTLNYVAIHPAMRVGWLILGIVMDIPMAGNATEDIAQFIHLGRNTHYNQNRSIDVSDMNSLIELKASLAAPVYSSESGTLKLIVTGSYPLKDALKGTASFDSTGSFSGIVQAPLPTLQAGLSYQFDLIH